jgi:hypothetical protein
MELLNKLLCSLFFLACLNTSRHIFFFILTAIKSEEGNKYMLTNRSLILLGISIAYIFTVVMTGIQIK